MEIIWSLDGRSIHKILWTIASLLHMYHLCLLQLYSSVKEVYSERFGLQSWKYLLSGSLQEVSWPLAYFSE